MLTHATRWQVAGLFVVAASIAAALVHAQTNRHDPRVLREDPLLAAGQLAPVLEGLGTHARKVTTESERAQLFFDQGLRLTYAFNHREALRAFKEAVRSDPDCAMAYWGWALVLGPNLNLPMRPEVVDQAWTAVQNAVARKHSASAVERDLIDALAARYSPDPDADRVALDAAYAEAMGALHRKVPNDPDVATLYAAALMNLSPWNYWTPDRKPRERTEEILSLLESATEVSPGHEGALHYYIHAVEPIDPDRGVAAADALRGRAPGAGHLVHMPSHIYMQVGRYAEAYEANVLAAQADEGYITQCQSQGIYALNYYPHNVHFLVWAAMMQGRSRAALEASRKVASRVPEDLQGDDWALYQTFSSLPLHTMVRFGMWDAIDADPEPPVEQRYWRGTWHYAKGLAHAHRGDWKQARAHLEALEALTGDPHTAETLVGFSNASVLLEIAQHTLAGEIDAAQGRLESAVAQLDRAVRLEDTLLYNEPPAWPYPTRHALAAMLLDAGRPREAEVVYWRDLTQNRENGFALFGLAQAVAAQGQDQEAAAIRKRFDAAWSQADVKLRSSRY